MSRNNNRKRSEPAEKIPQMSPFEKDVFLRVIGASVEAMHAQQPIHRVKAMDIYWDSMSENAIALAACFIRALRRYGVSEEATEQEGE